MLGGCATAPDSSSFFIASEDKRPPSTVKNICSILKEKPTWFRALNAVESEYGVPPHVVMAMMAQESSFRFDARPVAKEQTRWFQTTFASSAYGFSQALDMTWSHYTHKTGRYGAKRDSFSDSALFMGWYVDEVNKNLRLSKWDAKTQYIVYHEGQGGFRKKTHLEKPWLLSVAERVKSRAGNYWAQYSSCREDLKEPGNFFIRHFM